MKPCDIFIRGCVDVFSQWIIWLNFSWENDNPVFSPCLYWNRRKFGFHPQYAQTDCLTECGTLVGIYCLFWKLGNAHKNGSSTSNQRIKFFFKDLFNYGVLPVGNQAHLERNWFVFFCLAAKRYRRIFLLLKLICDSKDTTLFLAYLMCSFICQRMILSSIGTMKSRRERLKLYYVIEK